MNPFSAIGRLLAYLNPPEEALVTTEKTCAQSALPLQPSRQQKMLAERLADRSGQTRERAVLECQALADPSLLPLLAIRLNDWVPQVRDAAHSALLALLPLMPAPDVISSLPAIMKLRITARSDHSVWLADFESTLLGSVPADALMRGAKGDDMNVARACFDVLRRAPGTDTSALLLVALSSRRDIVIALQAAHMIDAEPDEAQSMLYLHALQSRFGAVRTLAIRALLRRQPADAARALATSVLLDPQSSVRGAATSYLIAQAVDVRAFYRALLEKTSPASGTVRICLTALAGLRNGGDAPLVRTYVASPTISIREAAYAAWLKLAQGDKDDIAGLALADEARTIRKFALDATRRQGAFIAFDAIRTMLEQRRDWAMLLQFAQREKWNHLEAIARIALATGSGHPVRPALHAELAAWVRGANGSYTRPSHAQAQFLVEQASLAALESLAYAGTGIAAILKHELASVPGTRM